MPPELSGYGLAKDSECTNELWAPFRTPADRPTKGHVRSGAPQRARLAMVVVATSDDAPVDAQDQVRGNRPVGRLLAQPAGR